MTRERQLSCHVLILYTLKSMNKLSLKISTTNHSGHRNRLLEHLYIPGTHWNVLNILKRNSFFYSIKAFVIFVIFNYILYLSTSLSLGNFAPPPSFFKNNSLWKWYLPVLWRLVEFSCENLFGLVPFWGLHLYLPFQLMTR